MWDRSSKFKTLKLCNLKKNSSKKGSLKNTIKIILLKQIKLIK